MSTEKKVTKDDGASPASPELGHGQMEEAGPNTPRLPEELVPEEEYPRDVIAMDVPTEPKLVAARAWPPRSPPTGTDVEVTVNLGGDAFDYPLRDDMQKDGYSTAGRRPGSGATGAVSREHLKGLLEALIFASDKPVRAADLAKLASAQIKEVKLLLTILKSDFSTRGVQLDEVAGGWIFRTHPVYAPFVRDLVRQRPVKLTRTQIETLAILAYRQPITRPEVDEIRGVDSGPVLKLLLERDLARILGKKDEPGRPLLYGTTTTFLEFFGLKSLKDLPTLREFTELNEDSLRVVERELGEVLSDVQGGVAAESEAPYAATSEPRTTSAAPPTSLPSTDASDLEDPEPTNAEHAAPVRTEKADAEEDAAEEDADDEYDDELFDDDDDDDDDEKDG